MAKNNSKYTSPNYLEFIPIPANGLKYDVTDGKVTIFQENTGMFNRIAQFVLKKPAISQIHLDEMGNFIWPHINGKNTIMDIAKIIKDEYGDKAEPLYNRVVQYFKTLASYGFIEFVEPSLFISKDA